MSDNLKKEDYIGMIPVFILYFLYTTLGSYFLSYWVFYTLLLVYLIHIFKPLFRMSFETGIKIKAYSYIDMSLDDDCIRYIPLSKIEVIIKWSDIKSLTYIRDEAMFQDIYGPYNETYWLIKIFDNKFIRIEDESIHRNLLVLSFGKRLARFDSATVKSAIKTKKQGVWDVYESN
jgi:hypothetical protein